VVIRTTGDRTWQGTLLLFSPRWPALLPPIVLIPLALWANRRMLIVLGLAILVAIFPLMGFCIGWHRFARAPANGLPMRIMAFNIHHLKLEDPAVARFLSDVHPDVVALEELPGDYHRGLFPLDSWHIREHGEIFLASRYPIVSSRVLVPEVAARYTLLTPAGPVDCVVVHLSSPHYALRDAVRGDDQGGEKLSRNIMERTEQAAYLAQLATGTGRPLILAGDFNLVPDSPLFNGSFPDLTDSFESTGIGFGWTYSTQWTSVRIDHVLSNRFFENTHFSRGPALGSPHFPIVADVILKAN
jgi:endonuclease/exonuclease/phosphatase family metal-dependent hydrolase